MEKQCSTYASGTSFYDMRKPEFFSFPAKHVSMICQFYLQKMLLHVLSALSFMLYFLS